MRNSTTGSILGVAVMAVVFAAGASAHNGRSATRQAPLAAASKPTAAAPIGMVQDWTNESVIFRNVETPEEAKARNRYERWKRLYRDPRFSLALTEKLMLQADMAATKTAGRPKPNPLPGPTPGEGSGSGSGSTSDASGAGNVHRDWSNVMGGGANGLGGNGSAGTYPAKYNFNVAAAPSCANDFVVYATNAAGATASGGTSETWTITFSGSPNAGQSLVIGGAAPRQVTLFASGSDNTMLNFLSAGTTTNIATNLRDAINRWTGQTGLYATSATNIVTIRSLTFEDLPNGNVTEGLSNATRGQTDGSDGTPGQPSIIAFNKLYNTYCATGGGGDAFRTNANAPDVYWAYNTGGTVRTSPTLSYYDGAKQVAFVQSNASNQAELVLLKWQTGNGTASAPATPALAATGADYRNGTGNCAGGVACMYKIAFNGTPNVTYSSPFIDYSGNIAYVGDDNGSLHKFTGIFAGNPAEVVGGGFPAVVSSGEALSPPVYDFGGNVFVGSQSVADTTDTSETWTLRIACNDGTPGPGTSCRGVNNTLDGFLTIDGNAFDAANNATDNNINVVGQTRSADRTNIVNKINGAAIGFTAVAAAGGCDDTNNTAACDITVTRTATGNVANTLVAVAGTNFSINSNTDGSSAAANGGRLYRINATNGAVTSSARLVSNNANTGFRATPMIDLKIGAVYASTANDGTNRAVYQFPLAFAAGATGSKVSIGLGTTSLAADAQYIGRFDSAYRSSTNGTGNLYVCGSLPGDDSSVALWKIPITAGVMGAPVQGATLSTTQSLCSPVSLVNNNGNQYLYAAVPAGGSAAGCTDACLYMFNLNDLGALEQWSFRFTASLTAGGGTFTVGAITFVAYDDGDQNVDNGFCTASGGNFDIWDAGGADHDGFVLRRCASLVPGFMVSGTGPDVIITRSTAGNVADTLVSEGTGPTAMANFSLQSHTDGAATTSTWATSNFPRAGLPVLGGASGIVLDNISALPGNSQIYFSNLGTPGSVPGNAIQTSQSGLQ